MPPRLILSNISTPLLILLSEEFCPNARLAVPHRAESYCCTSSIGRGCVTQQLGKRTAQIAYFNILFTLILKPEFSLAKIHAPEGLPILTLK
jgi:hypothetical protein